MKSPIAGVPKGVLAISAGLWSIAIASFFVTYHRPAAEPAKAPSEAPAVKVLSITPSEAIGDGSGLLTVGTDSHLPTIVEFGDYQCPPCRATEPKLKALVSSYPGKVRLVFRNLPLPGLHPRAMPAALLAETAKLHGEFAKAHDALYRSKLQPSDLEHLSKSLGLTDSEISLAAGGPAQQAIDNDLAFASRIGLNGTPSFLVCTKDGKVYQVDDLSNIPSLLDQ